MGWTDRPDGVHLSKELSTMRRFMPYLMPGRNEAAVYFEQRLDLSRTLPFLEAHNAARGEGSHVKLFQVILCAAVRTLAERPHLNRFIVGRRIYQRRDITLSFAVKKSLTDDASMTAVKIVFDPEDDLDKVGQRLKEAVEVGRGQAQTPSEQEMSALQWLPRGVLASIVRLQRWLDHHGLLPGALTRDDPLYASIFLANLGSVGLDAPYHHLFEYGTVPIFITVGRIKKAAVVDEQGAVVARDVVDLRYTFDERIVDGFYCARSLERFGAYIEDPSKLQGRPLSAHQETLRGTL